MGAPTWPPDPARAFAETAREYGVRPTDLGADADDEEFERALLAAFLFESPRGRLPDGAECGTLLASHQRALAAWLALISGGPVDLAASDPPATDGRRVFLPAALPAPARPEDAALLRAMALVQLGLLRFGLLEGEGLLGELYRDWVLRSCYHLLATRFVLDRWVSTLPGLGQQLASLPHDPVAGRMRINLTEVPREGMPGAFRPLYAGLVSEPTWGTPGAEADQARAAVAAVRALPRPSPAAWGQPMPVAEQAAARAVALGQATRLRRHFRQLHLGPPPLPLFAGILRPEWLLARIAHDPGAEEAWRDGPSPLRQLRAAQARASDPAPAPVRRGLRGRLKAGLQRALQGPGDPEALRRAPAYGTLRDEHQRKQAEAAGPARWSPGMSVEEVLSQAQAALPEAEEGTRHDEWDERLQAYRLGATRVIERPAPAGPLASHARLVAANERRIALVRRQFEALRLEERWLHGQLDGSDLDLDRAIAAYCDLAAGQEPDPRIYKRWQRQREQVALLVLVDLSGSTQGHVVHLEQEALVLLAEGLKVLRFPHALFGFHDDGALSCWMERLKGFDEGYDEPVLKRISNLQPGGATRLGAFLRHGALLLARQPEARRVLLVLSDGKPDGRAPYQGAYGLRDSAMAVQEGARLGVHSFCVSLDAGHDAPDYLSRVFGPGRFLALTQVDQLPTRLPEVLRRLVR